MAGSLSPELRLALRALRKAVVNCDARYSLELMSQVSINGKDIRSAGRSLVTAWQQHVAGADASTMLSLLGDVLSEGTLAGAVDLLQRLLAGGGGTNTLLTPDAGHQLDGLASRSLTYLQTTSMLLQILDDLFTPLSHLEALKPGPPPPAAATALLTTALADFRLDAVLISAMRLLPHMEPANSMNVPVPGLSSCMQRLAVALAGSLSTSVAMALLSLADPRLGGARRVTQALQVAVDDALARLCLFFHELQLAARPEFGGKPVQHAVFEWTQAVREPAHGRPMLAAVGLFQGPTVSRAGSAANADVSLHTAARLGSLQLLLTGAEQDSSPHSQRTLSALRLTPRHLHAVLQCAGRSHADGRGRDGVRGVHVLAEAYTAVGSIVAQLLLLPAAAAGRQSAFRAAVAECEHILGQQLTESRRLRSTHQPAPGSKGDTTVMKELVTRTSYSLRLLQRCCRPTSVSDAVVSRPAWRSQAEWILQRGLLATCEALLRGAAGHSPAVCVDACLLAATVAGSLQSDPHLRPAAVRALYSTLASARKAMTLEASTNMQARLAPVPASGQPRVAADRSAELYLELSAWPECTPEARRAALRCAALQLLASSMLRTSEVETSLPFPMLQLLHDEGLADLTAASGAPELLRFSLQSLTGSELQEEEEERDVPGLLDSRSEVRLIGRLLGAALAGDTSTPGPGACWRAHVPTLVRALRSNPGRFSGVEADLVAAYPAMAPWFRRPSTMVGAVPAAPTWDACAMHTLTLSSTEAAAGDGGAVAPFLGCCNSGCVNLDGNSEAVLPLRACSRCKVARYCSEECQRQAWRLGHRAACQALQQQQPA